MEIKDNGLRKLVENSLGLNSTTIAQQNLLPASNVAGAVSDTDNNAIAIVNPELNFRAAHRLATEEIKKQEVIEDIVHRADALLNKEKDSPESKDDVNLGWMFNFMERAGKTYDDNLKDYWAKLLAGEIRQPGSFSLRTLEVLRNISYEEAQLFDTFSKFVFVQSPMCFIFKNDNRYGLNYYDLSKLKETGLLQAGEATFTIKASKANTKYTYKYICGNKYIVLTTEPDTKDIINPVYLLTQAGCELYWLTELNGNIDYLKDFVSFIRKYNPTVSIRCGDVVKRVGQKVLYKREQFEI